MARDTLEDENGIPLIQGSRNDAPLHRSDGKRLKAPQPRKAQRGQKKKKKPAPSADNTGNTMEASSSEQQASTASSTRKKPAKKQALPAFDTLQSGNITASVIPPKSSKASYPNEESGIVETTTQDRIEEVLKRTPTRTSQVVTKPLQASAASIRERDIGQLKRRYAKGLSEEGDRFHVPFVPSDPDFPYDVPNLVVSLHVPQDYPSGLVELHVKSGLEIGFARNIEREFENERVGVASGRGLLGMLTWLDRNLERLLALKKSNTVKIVRHHAPLPEEQDDQDSSSESDGDDSAAYRLPIKFWTFHEKQEAAAQREAEVARLKTRLNPQAATEDTFDIQLEQVSVRLHVPALYPLEPCWILVLQGDENIEAPANCELRKASRDLVRQMNWILANLKLLAKQGAEESELLQAQLESEREAYRLAQSKAGNSAETWSAEHDGFRPVVGFSYSVSEQQEDPSSSANEDCPEDVVDEDFKKVGITDRTTQADRGTAIDCSVSMRGISTFEATSITLTVKCHRCKANTIQVNDIKPVKPTQIACPHCMSVMSIGLRPLLVHAGNLKRIGYLDLEGCSATLVGLVSLSAACAECPVPDEPADQQAQIFTGVGTGQAQTKPCRLCHAKLHLELNHFHFLTLSNTYPRPGTRLGRITDTQPAAIPKGANKSALRQASKHKGQSLPDFGLCRHYRRSFRWFRFPCCRRVFACDLCHDLLAGAAPISQTQGGAGSASMPIQVAGVASGKHRHELANFQICGFCSTEAPVNPQAHCHACGASLVKPGSAPGTLGSGFWEGGEGTRDQRLMNRHDKRKHRKKI
ncbi:hypothetical protein BCR37DRAFT_14937 [Protomyces lactucae-debilis]|uniref:CHY-type domain-containing protein n=1 Tax=Protomyces lactucae-debilis TaxID=2754530 RepID=A0A1Y2FV44_PROLT|nr:uncharacterized protein BCR37DRAFT_14937 [Protomyces lactucae-debilis]ORY87868.1 hypothetical protein BCR37DRAFT_14937 [Protomyces lactucae-debilis]